MKNRKSKKFTKRRTSEKNIIPQVVGGIIGTGAVLGATKLFYDYYTRIRVLLINDAKLYVGLFVDGCNDLKEFMKDKTIENYIYIGYENKGLNKEENKKILNEGNYDFVVFIHSEESNKTKKWVSSNIKKDIGVYELNVDFKENILDEEKLKNENLKLLDLQLT